jgi:hypothetical protein
MKKKRCTNKIKKMNHKRNEDSSDGLKNEN